MAHLTVITERPKSVVDYFDYHSTCGICGLPVKNLLSEALPEILRFVAL